CVGAAAGGGLPRCAWEAAARSPWHSSGSSAGGADPAPDASTEGGERMTVAIVTDTACDLSEERAAAAGISLVPLLVRFGDVEQKAVVELSVPAFYTKLLAPGSPFPSTAACAPGDFMTAFQQRLDAGAEGIVCLTVGSRLSATHKAAIVARDAMPGAPIHVVDTET